MGAVSEAAGLRKGALGTCVVCAGRHRATTVSIGEEDIFCVERAFDEKASLYLYPNQLRLVDFVMDNDTFLFV